MPKEEWGKKRVCPVTGKRFYDLNRNPIVSPYTGQIVTVETGRGRVMVADAEDAATKRLKAGGEDEDLLLDDEAEDADVDLGDEVLEDDEDEEVSFEELGDVAGDEE